MTRTEEPGSPVPLCGVAPAALGGAAMQGYAALMLSSQPCSPRGDTMQSCLSLSSAVEVRQSCQILCATQVSSGSRDLPPQHCTTHGFCKNSLLELAAKLTSSNALLGGEKKVSSFVAE